MSSSFAVKKRIKEKQILNCSHKQPTQLIINNSFKLDGVGPVDNRPSTDKLHQFVKKNI